MQITAIEWTATVNPDGTTTPGYSANPLKYRRKSDGKVVWACVKTSPGCSACYAEAIALRYDRGALFNAANMEELEPFLDEAELRKMLTYKPASGKRCFVGDMTDLFGPWVPDEILDRLFAVFACRRDVLWQVLTKRAERLLEYIHSRSKSAKFWKTAARKLGYSLEFEGISLVPFPLPNVHLGVSVESPAYLDRIDHLRRTPAAVRFLSCEPLLADLGTLDLAGIHWVIAGGESGPRARPMHPAWVRSIRDQCQAAGVPFFFKQWGEWFPSAQYDCDTGMPHLTGRKEIYLGPAGEVVRTASPFEHGQPCDVPADYVSMVRVGKKAAGRLLDGRTWDEMPEGATL